MPGSDKIEPPPFVRAGLINTGQHKKLVGNEKSLTTEVSEYMVMSIVTYLRVLKKETRQSLF